MRAGLLRDEITVEKLTTMKDSYGSIEESWEAKLSTRAEVKYNSGNRAALNNEIIHTSNITFIVRYYHPIDESDRILYKGKRYRILSISRELYKQTISIITELINE